MGIKVKLKEDLTKYHPLLKSGLIGDATPLDSYNGCYAKVRFPFIPAWDILWKSLDIVDDEYLLKKQKVEEEMLQAKHVTMTWGKSGGFQCLEIMTKTKRYHAFTSINRAEGLKILKKLIRLKVPIQEVGKPNDRNQTEINN